jgi:DNA repair protein RadC
LIEVFGSLGRVIAAAPKALERAAGSAAVGRRISAARDAVLAAQRETLVRAKFDLRDQRLQKYIVGLFKELRVERLHAIYLDAAGCYLSDGPLSEGGGERVAGTLRMLVARAFNLDAAAVVLAHNHPSGAAYPSREDVSATARLASSLSELELRLQDHLIVAGTTIYSMSGAGRL